eukprot:SAG22_NODE_7_length_40155_cov_25.241356_43_plen_383_part_00
MLATSGRSCFGNNYCRRRHHRDRTNSTCQTNDRSSARSVCTKGSGTREPMVQTQTLLAFLAGGPYGPSDGAGSGNRSLIMRSCREDGVLLRADKPATLLDRAFTTGLPFRRCHDCERCDCGPACPAGSKHPGSGSPFDLTCHLQNVWATHSDVPGAGRYGYVLGLDLTKPFSMTAADLLPAGGKARGGEEVPSYAVWESWHGVNTSAMLRPGESFTVPAAAASLRGPAIDPAIDPAVISSSYTVFSPVLANGWSYLGEPYKIVAASARRVLSVRAAGADGNGLSVRLVGAPDEVITVALRTPPAELSVVVVVGGGGGGGGRTVTLQCTFPSSGTTSHAEASSRWAAASSSAVEDVELGINCQGLSCKCLSAAGHAMPSGDGE